MVFAGVKDAEEIDDLWAYLLQFNSDSGGRRNCGPHPRGRGA
jgi:hypothetical protein